MINSLMVNQLETISSLSNLSRNHKLYNQFCPCHKECHIFGSLPQPKKETIDAITCIQKLCVDVSHFLKRWLISKHSSFFEWSAMLWYTRFTENKRNDNAAKHVICSMYVTHGAQWVVFFTQIWWVFNHLLFCYLIQSLSY